MSKFISLNALPSSSKLETQTDTGYHRGTEGGDEGE
jgi:hypothetical protein